MPSNAAARAVVGLAWESAANEFESDPDALSFAVADDDAWTAFAGRSYSGLTGASLTRSGAGAGAPPTSPPYSATWIGANGAWENAANWTVTDPGEPAHSVPGADDAVVIGGYTVSFNSTDTIWSLTTEGTLHLGEANLGPGTLTLTHNSEIGGSLDIGRDDSLDIAPGQTLVVAGDNSMLYAGGFYPYGSIDGGGTLEVTGSADFGGNVGETTATNIVDAGAIVETERVDLYGSSSLTITAGATYTCAHAGLSGGIISNAGNLNIVGDGLNSGVTISSVLTNTGNLDIPEFIVLDFYGTATLMGTLEGGGTLSIAPDAQVTFATANIGFGAIICDRFTGVMTFNVSASYAGDFEYVAAAGKLDIASGTTLTLSQGYLEGDVDIDGGGTLRVNGAIVLGGDATIGTTTATSIVDTGSIAQSGNVHLNGSLTIAAGHTYILGSGGSLGGGDAIIDNAGTLIAAGGSSGDLNTISGVFTNTGVLTVDYGYLLESAGSVFTNSGKIFVGTPASVFFKTEILGSGSEVIQTYGYLELDAQSTAAQGVIFEGHGGELGLGDAGQFQSSIYEFDAGPVISDSIDLIGFDSSSTESFASASDGLIVNISDGSKSASLHFVGSYNQSLFQLDAGSNGELLYYLNAPPSPPYIAQWNATAGAWEDAKEWVVTDPGGPPNSVPGADDAVLIGNNGSSGYTVTYNSTDTIWSLTAGRYVTLDIQSGGLTITHTSGIGGALYVDIGAALSIAQGATLNVASQSYFNGALDIAHGATLILSGYNSLVNYDVDGGGTLDVTGSAYLNATIGVTTATDIVDAGTIVQTGDITLNGSFSIDSGRSFTIGYGNSFQIFSGASAATFGGDGATINIAGKLIEGSVDVPAIPNKVTVSGVVTNTGRIFLGNQAAMIVTGEILGSGWEAIERRAYLELDAQSTASQKVIFDGNRAELGLADAGQFQSSIYDFDEAFTQLGPTQGNAIDLIGFDSNASTSFASVSGGVIVNISDGMRSASLNFVGTYYQNGFHLNAGSNGELLTYSF